MEYTVVLLSFFSVYAALTAAFATVAVKFKLSVARPSVRSTTFRCLEEDDATIYLEEGIVGVLKPD